nr:CCE_0567 family metalloprotein [uncultured Carboxylicivirga sp.]
MSTEEIKDLEKEVNKLKFKAGLKASELHDLVEDRLYADFEDLIPFAEATYAACKAWNDKMIELQKIKAM